MRRPRLAFVGVGWIGRARMESVVRAGAADAAAVVDLDEELAAKAAAEVECDRVGTSLAAALTQPCDGVVLATPSALHAEQALEVLDRGLPVFCQKPLARTTAETTAIVEAARRNDLLLGVDLSYRHVEAFAAARAAIAAGELGRPYALELTFHNAYGPDKGWALDPALSGGGCVIDLGTHLVDLALQVFEDEPVAVNSALFARGERLPAGSGRVEDHAVAQLDFGDGRVARLACSWFMASGRDAVIEAHVHGTEGGVAVRNLGGSFYDFIGERYRDGSVEVLAMPPDDWGGRALLAWARALRNGGGFDPEVESSIRIARVIDAIYGRAA